MYFNFLRRTKGGPVGELKHDFGLGLPSGEAQVDEVGEEEDAAEEGIEDGGLAWDQVGGATVGNGTAAVLVFTTVAVLLGFKLCRKTGERREDGRERIERR